MGLDLHVGDHYWSFHVPTPVVLLVALLALCGVWNLAWFILAATSN
jgi:hypothetical protein